MLFTLAVDGELFEIRPGQYGGTSYDWITGPNKGYGIASSGPPDQPAEEHQREIRGFLAMVDPRTGYIEDA